MTLRKKVWIGVGVMLAFGAIVSTMEQTATVAQIEARLALPDPTLTPEQQQRWADTWAHMTAKERTDAAKMLSRLSR